MHLPLPTVGDGGRQGEIYPGKRKPSLSLRECVSMQGLSLIPRGAGLGMGNGRLV